MRFLLLLLLLPVMGCDGRSKKATVSAFRQNMPLALTNTAMTGYEHDTLKQLYVFGGLGAQKTYSDITLRSFCYDISENKWEEIDPLPDTLGKIAAAASRIGDKIYIAGGYHVYEDGHERSSNRLHIYDPLTESYLEDASPIPVAIDDHVQAVYRDSLLYLISGWHDTANVNIVQIYDPAHNLWVEGTPLPHSPGSYVFGASGLIAGDTIYMAGGAGNRVEKDFSVQGYFTKGYINPSDPSGITWTQMTYPHAAVYRSAVLLSGNRVIWVGGASDSYNYSGISYKGIPVSPRTDILVYDIGSGKLSVEKGFLNEVMDLRGAAIFNNGKTYLAGGMLEDQTVSDSLVEVKY